MPSPVTSDPLAHAEVTGMDRQQHDRLYSRRAFIGRAGASAGAVALGGGFASAVAHPVHAVSSQFATTDPQHFGRLFPNLEPFAPASPGVTRSLLALGAPGGLLDAQDPLSAGPVALITNPLLSANNPDN